MSIKLFENYTIILYRIKSIFFPSIWWRLHSLTRSHALFSRLYFVWSHAQDCTKNASEHQQNRPTTASSSVSVQEEKNHRRIHVTADFAVVAQKYGEKTFPSSKFQHHEHLHCTVQSINKNYIINANANSLLYLSSPTAAPPPSA